MHPFHCLIVYSNKKNRISYEKDYRIIDVGFIGASTTIYAQESKSESRRAERKAQRDAEKAREKIEEERAYTDAVQAIKERKFVLEADRVTFKRGRSAFVTSNTNFILLNGNRASVQIAFNGAFAGPNGIGGVTGGWHCR